MALRLSHQPAWYEGRRDAGRSCRTEYGKGIGDGISTIPRQTGNNKVQIKTVVNNVVFPVIDLILAVLF
ncbi:MAG: DUF3852 family protein, partial [Erysipelotrichaceae bacterium]|nr:DUF3852 family protein [Erysipelotrichaceae bacterium]